MVYIHFPSNLTEEELMLQAKYQKLKKKKKALQALKAPKQEPDKPMIKRPSDARDAREVARKLLKSGSIQPILKPALKQDQTSFKRPKGQERKRIHSDSSGSVPYQPFSNVPTTPETPEKDSPRFTNLYQQIAIERDREERGLVDKKPSSTATSTSPSGDTSPRADKRTGNTIYVSGQKVTEEFLRKHFSDFGEIVHVSMEIEKGRGFVTFNKPECTEKAISEMHSKTVSGTQLQVQLARRQPQIEPINDASSSAVWSTLAASHSQKGGHKDKRELVTYDDVF